MKSIIKSSVSFYHEHVPAVLRKLVPEHWKSAVIFKLKSYGVLGAKRVNQGEKKIRGEANSISVERVASFMEDGRLQLALRGAKRIKRYKKPKDYLVCAQAFRKNLYYERAEAVITVGLQRYPENFRLWKEGFVVSRGLRDYENAFVRLKNCMDLKGNKCSVSDYKSLIGLYTTCHEHGLAHNAFVESVNIFGRRSALVVANAQNFARLVMNKFNAVHLENNAAYAKRISPELGFECVVNSICEGVDVCCDEASGYENVREVLVKSLCILAFCYNDPIKNKVVDALLKAVFGSGAARKSEAFSYIQKCFHDSAGKGAEIVSVVERDVQGGCLTKIDLVCLERVLLWMGELKSASEIKMISARALVSSVKSFELKSEYVEMAALTAAACLEREDSLVMLAILLESRASVGPRLRLKGVEACCRLMQGDADALRKFWRRTLTAEELMLDKILAGKSVAIVAPAPGDIMNGDEIDSFDIVLRLNTVCAPPETAWPRHGKRADITAFNGTKAHILSAELGAGRALQLDEGILCALFKNQKVSVAGEQLVVAVGRDRKKDLSWYLGESINHVPHLIFYLLGSSASRIKIFNANFFLSSDSHESSYGRAPIDLTSLVFSDSLDASHRFARSVWLNGLVEADVETGKVLGMSTLQYMEEMQKIYA